MLVIGAISAALLAIFLFGTLVIALVVTTRYGDPSASYKLFAVRDRLVDAVVFKGVSRSNVWVETLYENVNNILMHSNLLCGPERWPLAAAVGRYQAHNPQVGRKMVPLPSNEACPKPISEIRDDLRLALTHLVRNHFGIALQMSTHEREQLRIQREKAQSLLEMIGSHKNGQTANVH